MIRARAPIKIEEIGVEDPSWLEGAQEAALPVFAATVVHLIRSRLDNDQYIVENGFVEPRGKMNDDRLSASTRLQGNRVSEGIQ